MPSLVRWRLWQPALFSNPRSGTLARAPMGFVGDGLPTGSFSESRLFLLCHRVVCDPNHLKRATEEAPHQVCPLAQGEFSEKSSLSVTAPGFLYPAAVPAIPFSNIFFSSSVSPTGGKQVVPEQTTAAALSLSK